MVTLSICTIEDGLDSAALVILVVIFLDGMME